MRVQREKLRELIARPFRPVAPDEVRREGKVLLVGGELSPQQALEAAFDTHAVSPVETVWLRFPRLDRFHVAEETARLIKRNLNVLLVGTVETDFPPYMLERAYAAGVDLIEIPMEVNDAALARERGISQDAVWKTLGHARSIFPRNCVLSRLSVGEEALCSTVSGVDRLLNQGIVPLVFTAGRASDYPLEEVEQVFVQLAAAWRKKKVQLSPLLPIIDLVSPLTAAKGKSRLNGFLSRIQYHGLLAASDLRRTLRVKKVEESYESSGL